jgi:hypothetical protein
MGFRLLLRILRSSRLRKTLERLYTRRRRDTETVEPVTPILESRAAQALREYLDAHAANLERVARLKEKAERLEKAGIPSESARNRAERARGEVLAGLDALRASFVEATGRREGARAFDRVMEQQYPAFKPNIYQRPGVPGNAPGRAACATLAPGP